MPPPKKDPKAEDKKKKEEEEKKKKEEEREKMKEAFITGSNSVEKEPSELEKERLAREEKLR
jgi:hypothetical protein